MRLIGACSRQSVKAPPTLSLVQRRSSY